jgi:signal transduction histidine kinase
MRLIMPTKPTSPVDLATMSTLGYDHLLRVSQVGDRLMGIIATGHTEQAWQAVADEFRSALGAEHTAFFLVPFPAPDERPLKAVSPKSELPDVPDSVTTQLKTHTTEGTVERLAIDSQEWSARIGIVIDDILQINLRGRGGNLLAVLLVSHQNGQHFSGQDVTVARFLAEKAAIPLNLLRTLKILRTLRRAIHQATNRDEILAAILRSARILLRSERAWLVIPVGTSGLDHRTLENDKLVPLLTPHPESRVVPAMLKGSGATELTPHRMCAPVVWEGQAGPVAILEMLPPPSEQFDEQDWNLLCWVAKHAASDCDLAARSLPPTDSPSTLTEFARSIADNIRRTLRFKGGLVYTAIPRTRALHGLAGCGSPEAQGVTDIRPWVFPIDPQPGMPRSAAVVGYESNIGGKVWPNPWEHPDEVDPVGLTQFDIQGALIAVPLAVPSASGKPDRIGSLVFWADRMYREDERPDLEQHRRTALSLAESAARLLRLAMFTKTREQRDSLQQEVTRVMRGMMTEIDLNKNLSAILAAIARLAFPRVRLYQFRYSNSFVGLTAVGMDKTISNEEFRRIRLVAVDGDQKDANFYAKQMYDSVRAARRTTDGEEPTGLLAQVHYPTSDHPQAPECAQLGKANGKPWAEVPILLGGKLYGLIAADHHGTDREIRDDDLEVLDVFAGLAAEAFQICEKRGVLANLDVLHERVGPDQEEDLVYRRLLLFAVHGEGGLGFSRAVLYTAVADEPGVFEFRHGVGSLNEETFLQVAKETYEWSLAQVLDAADPMNHDQRLNSAPEGLKGHRITVPSSVLPAGPVIVRTTDRVNQTNWVTLCERFGPVVLVAPVRFANGYSGLLVVDRVWQHQWKDIGLGPDDELNLAAYARHVGEILTRHVWTRRLRSYVQSLYSKVGHELTDPMDALRAAIYQMQHESQSGNGPVNKISDAPTESARLAESQSDNGSLNKVIVALDELYNSLLGILLCGDLSKRSLIRTLGSDIWAAVEGEIRGRASVPDVRLEPSLRAGTPMWVLANLASVRLAVRELLRNAIAAVGRPTTDGRSFEKRVVIEVTWPVEYCQELWLEIAVWNPGGPGLDAEQKRQFDHGDPVRSSKRSDRDGIGLLLVRQIAELHSGRFLFNPEEPDGTRAVLLLPPYPLRGVSR